jgi:hypothetical protein
MDLVENTDCNFMGWEMYTKYLLFTHHPKNVSSDMEITIGTKMLATCKFYHKKKTIILCFITGIIKL